MTPLDRLHLTASRQHWVVTLADLHTAGLGKEAIRHAVRSQRIFRRYPGVYVVGRRSLSETGQFLAAALACGEAGVLSHLAAARLWGVWEHPISQIDVTVPTQAGHTGPRGIKLHRSAALLATDCDLRHGVPVTTLRRTLIDIAGAVTPRQLRSALRRAEQDLDLCLTELYRHVEEPRCVAKYVRLRRALQEWVPKADLTESDLELEFLDFCRRHRLPLPEPQRWFGRRYRPDFVWEDLKLIVETDSWRYHRGAIQGQADAAKDRAMKARGYEVLRFTWAEIVNRPQAVARELRAAFARRTANSSRVSGVVPPVIRLEVANDDGPG